MKYFRRDEVEFAFYWQNELGRGGIVARLEDDKRETFNDIATFVFFARPLCCMYVRIRAYV